MTLTCVRGRPQEYEDDMGTRYWSVSEVLTVLDPHAFAAVDPYVMAAAQERGTDLHVLFGVRLLAMSDLAEAPRRPAGILGHYYDGIEKFVRERKPKPIKVEQSAVHETLRYAGTVDTESWLDGEDWIIDLKTGPPRAVHAAQLHAYKKLAGHEKVTRLGSLYIDRKGQYRLREHTRDHVNWAGFMAGLAVLEWHRMKGK